MDTKYSYFPNIISHYLEPKDNTVGKDSFLLYRDNAGTIKLAYGQIKRDGSLPEINSTVDISKDPALSCFDAVLFMEDGLAVVDCTLKGGKVFSTYTNYWYIVDLTNHSIKKTLKNDLYVGYTEITKRQLVRFSHPEAGGFTYMLRTYLSDGVDKEHSDNTYMEVFIVPREDPTEIEPLRVIDRTFLNLNVLRIMDVQLYLDDIFLLDYDTGLFRLDILQSQRVAITGRYRDRGFTKFGIYSDDMQDECIVALANPHTVYEIDWHKITQPTLISKYSLMESSTIKQVRLNDKYLLVQSTALAKNETNPSFEVDYTWVFTKGSRTYLNAYHVIDHNSSTVQIEFDRENNRLYIADEQGLTLTELSSANLILHYMDQSLIGKEIQIVVQAKSTDPHSNQSLVCQEVFTAILVSKDNMTLFPSGMTPTKVYSVNYPKPLEIPL